jgi:hypothetical protein
MCSSASWYISTPCFTYDLLCLCVGVWVCGCVRGRGGGGPAGGCQHSNRAQQHRLRQAGVQGAATRPTQPQTATHVCAWGSSTTPAPTWAFATRVRQPSPPLPPSCTLHTRARRKSRPPARARGACVCVHMRGRCVLRRVGCTRRWLVCTPLMHTSGAGHTSLQHTASKAPHERKPASGSSVLWGLCSSSSCRWLSRGYRHALSSARVWFPRAPEAAGRTFLNARAARAARQHMPSSSTRAPTRVRAFCRSHLHSRRGVNFTLLSTHRSS